MKTQNRGSTEQIIYRPATDEDAPAAQTGTLPVRTTHPREAAAIESCRLVPSPQPATLISNGDHMVSVGERRSSGRQSVST